MDGAVAAGSRHRRRHPAGDELTGRPTIAFLPWHDRFEDFYDTIGVTLADFQEELVGNWMFNYVAALRGAGVDTLLVYASARVAEPVRFIHRPSGARVSVLPSPVLHRKAQGLRDRLFPWSRSLRSLESYLATPVRLLARELRREGCSAILCQDYEHGRFDTSVILGRLLRLPVFATFQGALARRPWEYPLRRLTVPAAAGLVVGSIGERQRLRARYGVGPPKVVDIPNPLDVDGWAPVDRGQARARLGIPPEARVVEWHGRIERHVKGLDVLADGWERLCRERPDAPLLLLLAGSGSDAGWLRQRLKGFAPGRVRWIDHYVRDRDVLRDHIAAADLFVLPSRIEGVPVAPLEAMAGGRPVVATDIPGVSDVVGEGEGAGGLLVPVDDPAALASGLARLLDDPQLCAVLGERARLRVSQQASLEAVGRRLRSLLSVGGGLSPPS